MANQIVFLFIQVMLKFYKLKINILDLRWNLNALYKSLFDFIFEDNSYVFIYNFSIFNLIDYKSNLLIS